MKRVLLYWHTLKYLKPVQFWYRFWYYFYKPTPISTVTIATRTPIGNWIGCQRKSSMVSECAFRFLNQINEITTSADWNRAEFGDLWMFNAHYFDDLNADGAASRTDWHRRLIDRWVAENPASEGVGWHAYATSLRIVNWLKWLLAPNATITAVETSLPIQADWLSKNLEYHLQANHLWANAKALVFAGVYYEGALATKWLSQGSILLKEQLQIQILGDGGHYERSPMYHAIVVEDLLDILQLNDKFPSILGYELVENIRQIVPRMFDWLYAMRHPDGEIALFNDATFGIAPRFDQLENYAKQIGFSETVDRCDKSVELLDTGYVRLVNSAAVLIADVGEVGPNYQPGHAHADSLSFELSLFNSRVVVNSGIDRYVADSERIKQRGTAAHSTLEVNGENSSEVWSSFRVARRARPFNLSTSYSGDGGLISCSHDGYTRLAGGIIHTREWELGPESLEVKDTVRGRFEKSVARYFLHPEVIVLRHDEFGCVLSVAKKEIFVNVVGASLRLVKSAYHPGFNTSIDSHCLELTLSSSNCVTSFNWSDVKSD